ncbi:MAG: 2-dehydropantoate 2-reductase [Chloroflexota bacterium]|nr:2-dehydropantoate 2-reductase [Chloroflexota bacterium]
MKEIKRVAILGAGALGSYFAAQFFDTPEFSTFLIAKGSRRERLERDGLVINGKAYQIPVLDPDQASEPVDLIVVVLKQYHLAEALQGLETVVGEDTVFVSFMNGLESEECIGSVFGMEKVLYGISVGIDALRVGNQMTTSRPGKHYFGELDNSELNEKVIRVQKAFEKAGITYETPQDMLRIMWWKFMINVGMNQGSAVMRAPYGIFHNDRNAQALMEALMREVIALAVAQGINLSDQDIDEWYPFLRALSPQGKTSMLQDIEAGRKTEVDIFGGKMVEMGKKYGIPTPVNETMLRIIRVLEQNPG